MTPTHRGSSKPGLIAALVLALVFIGTLAWFFATGRGPRDANAANDFDDVPTVTEILGGVESGGGLNLQFADKDDPSRIAATLEADTIRPAKADGVVEPNFYELERIRAKVFLDAGDTVLIESERGRFYMPDRRTGPDYGSLIGSPVITLLAEGTNEPKLIARMDETLRFNFIYSRVETPGRLHVQGRGIEFQGNNVAARLNQQRERIDELEVQRGDFIKYDPSLARTDAPEDTPPPPPSARRPGPVGSAGGPRIVPAAFEQPAEPEASEPDRRDRQDATASASPRSAPHLAHYLATFRDSVELRQAGKRVTADQLDAWIRLVDHKLPDRTRSGTGQAADAGPLSLLWAIVAQVEEAAPPAASATAPAPLGVGSGDELVELTWTGRLRVVPLVEGEPEPLARDDASFRFTATETGLVRFEDQASSGHAAVAEYAATREVLTLTGPGASVLLEAEDKGWIEASKTVVRLASGEVTVVGPGQINDGSRSRPAPDRRLVRWVDQADFAFAMVGDKMTGDIERASFAGEARAVDGERRVEGEMIVAHFVADAHGNRVVSRVEADRMRATDGKGATMVGRRIEVPFAQTAAGRSEPSEVFASGEVVVTQDDKQLAAEVLSAELVHDADGKLTARNFIAQRGARYTEGDRIEATADRIEADGIDQIAVLIGTAESPAVLVHERSTIVGPHIRMAQDPQRGAVTGAGRFEQIRDDGRIEAFWAEGMFFDRSFGVLECAGKAQVNQTLADGETRHATGDQLTVEFVDAGGEIVFDAASIFGDGDGPAIVETRRPADGADEPITLMNLRSSEILATGGGSGLIVPKPGRLVMLDRRAPDAGGRLDGWDRGHAMFHWSDTMVVDRLIGTARFSGDAQAVHRAQSDGRTAELAADTILASFVENESEAAEITALHAEGTAYFRMADREVLAAVLRFDTVAGIVYAASSPQTPIRFIDNATGAVMSARTLEWNLQTERVEVDGPTPLTLPRGGG